MKGRSDSRRNAPMQALQPLKGFEGIGVSDDARDLSAAGRIGGLALRAGLGLHRLAHGREYDTAVLCGNRFRAGKVIQPKGFAVRVDPNSFSLGSGEHESGERRGGVGRNLVSGAVHVVLRVGPIPTMCLSSHVTSDRSTTVRRSVS